MMRSDDILIEDFVAWLREKFPRLIFLVKKPLRELFPEPKKYKGFWGHRWSHADTAVFRHGRLCCILEPGGFQHLTDRDQKARDREKRSICEEFDVSYLPLMNLALHSRELKEFRKLLKNAFYAKGGVELS